MSHISGADPGSPESVEHSPEVVDMANVVFDLGEAELTLVDGTQQWARLAVCTAGIDVMFNSGTKVRLPIKTLDKISDFILLLREIQEEKA